MTGIINVDNEIVDTPAPLWLLLARHSPALKWSIVEFEGLGNRLISVGKNRTENVLAIARPVSWLKEMRVEIKEQNDGKARSNTMPIGAA